MINLLHFQIDSFRLTTWVLYVLMTVYEIRDKTIDITANMMTCTQNKDQASGLCIFSEILT